MGSKVSWVCSLLFRSPPEPEHPVAGPRDTIHTLAPFSTSITTLPVAIYFTSGEMGQYGDLSTIPNKERTEGRIVSAYDFAIHVIHSLVVLIVQGTGIPGKSFCSGSVCHGLGRI